MPNRTNKGAIPVSVGNISSVVREILKEEGIFSEGSSNFLVANRSRQPRTTLGGAGQISRDPATLNSLSAFTQFENLLQEQSENKLAETFFDLAWGTKEGFGSAKDLKQAFQAATEGALENQEIEVQITGAEREQPDLIQFWSGKDDELREALNYPVGDIGRFASDGGFNSLNFITLGSNAFDAGARNTDLLAVWLRGVPATDISRAIPYVRVTLLQSASSTGIPEDSDENPRLSWDFNLEGSSPGGKSVAWSKSDEFAERFRRTSRTSTGSIKTENEKSVYRALPDVMNAPQSYRPFMARKEVLDPSVPQLGLLNLSITTQSSGHGMIALRTASMALKLFDRSRMRDIAPLISPQFRSSVGFEIEWGWRCDLPDAMHNPYTRMIENMRVKEYWGLTNSNFSFNDDGSVNIDLRLHNQPLRDMERLDIAMGAIGVDDDDDDLEISSLVDDVTNAATELLGYIQSSRGASSDDLDVNVSEASFLGRFSTVEDILDIEDGDPVIRQIRDFIDAYSDDDGSRPESGSSAVKNSSNPSEEERGRLKGLIRILKKLFGEHTPEARAARDRTGRFSRAGSSPESVSITRPVNESSARYDRANDGGFDGFITDTTALQRALDDAGVTDFRAREFIRHKNARWPRYRKSDDMANNPIHFYHKSVSPINITKAAQFAQELQNRYKPSEENANRRIRITSGYRNREYNNMLRARSNNVAENSYHIAFTALDLSPVDGDMDEFRRIFNQLVREWRGRGEIVGAGHYNSFSHVDVSVGSVGRTSNANFGTVKRSSLPPT